MDGVDEVEVEVEVGWRWRWRLMSRWRWVLGCVGMWWCGGGLLGWVEWVVGRAHTPSHEVPIDAPHKQHTMYTPKRQVRFHEKESG